MSEPETADVDAATGQKSPAVRGKKRKREQAVEGGHECEVSPETKKVLSALLDCTRHTPSPHPGHPPPGEEVAEQAESVSVLCQRSHL